MSKDYIASIVDNIASALNLTDYNYSEEEFESIAQNFFGLLLPLTLKAKHNDEAVSIEVVLKLAPADERYRVSGALTLFFAREIYVYTNLLQKYSELQEHFPNELQHLMPKCYFVCRDYCKEAIAIENMCASGFEPYTNIKFLDYDHTVVSLQALAKYHALSFILKEKDPEIFETVSQDCPPLTQETNERFMFIVLDRLEKAMRVFESEPKYLGLIKFMKEHCKNHVEAAAFSVQQRCICHGDIWKENFLYKYTEDHKPVKACLIDYQTVRMSSAAYDTLFFITTSTSKALRNKPQGNFQRFIDTYYQTFTSLLHFAGLEAQNVYSREMFDLDLRTVAPACFIIANTAIWLSSGLQQEGHVRSKQVFNSESEREEAVNIYRSRTMDIIEDFICYGFFNPLASY